MVRRIAFFDFDGTITRHDTFGTFALHALGRLRVMAGVVAASPVIAAWKLGLTTNSRAKERLFSSLYSGMDYGRFCRLGDSFADVVDRDLRPSVEDELRRHVSAGHEVYIVSASMGEWIRPWAGRHGITGVIATVPEVGTDGCLTGRFAGPNCHGAEKSRRIRAAMPDVDGCETWGYGDSSGDDAMLAMVSHPSRV